ncbi:MAG TPA: sulfotransferase [Streptosporangiaceae bacterium]
MTSPGRSVLVLGMHRSGTSVVTRVIALLGLPLCREEDRYAAPDNPTGHWESTSLIAFNDRLLNLFGGIPAAPAAVADGWESHASAVALYDEAYRVFKRAHPGAVWVWKDPRTCLTLPFWRRVLPDSPVAVFVHREPLEVVLSLQRRDGFGKAHCIAQWERYSRCALRGAAGMPLVAVRFADLVSDPVDTVAQLRADLAGLDVPVLSDSRPAEQFVAAERAVNRHLRLGLATDPDATGAQRVLLAAIDSLPRVCASFGTMDLGKESASTTELLSTIRERGISPPGLRVVAREIWPAVRRSATNRLPHKA